MSDAPTQIDWSQGVPLMAGRSIAVDRSLHAYGTPFFIEADLPIVRSAVVAAWCLNLTRSATRPFSTVSLAVRMADNR